MKTFILTARGQSGRGLVAAISQAAVALECNIIDCSQFVDEASQTFFLRMSLRAEGIYSSLALVSSLTAAGSAVGLDVRLHDTTKKQRVVIFVSRFGHCLNDLLYRWRIGALPIEIAAVISNHKDYEKTVIDHGLPFYFIPVTPATKAAAEAEQMMVIRKVQADLIVLARYMQVLSDTMCRAMSERIINIHHSFLPSFKGANPYGQAFEKGVKLIGATAHYVTADLDEGPIIEQDAIRVTHGQNQDDYVSLGRDVEAQVLSRAVHAHIHRRVFVNGNKTIVFAASPGTYASERMG